MNQRTPVIVAVDLETTGFEPPEAKVVEIGLCRLDGRRGLLPDAYGDWRAEDAWLALLVNPGEPIPPETSAIHHIVDEDVRRFDDWAATIEGLRPIFAPPADGGVEVVAFAAHNMKMERQWLDAEIGTGAPWIDTWKCALRLWPDAPSHANQALRYWRKPATIDRATATPAHRAGPDAYVTAHLLAAMLQEASLEQLVAWSAEPALLTRIPFGQLRGEPWSEADDGLLEWVLHPARDFDENVKHTARVELERRREERRLTGDPDYGVEYDQRPPDERDP